MICLKKFKRSLPWFNNNYDAAWESGPVTSYVGICVGMESTLGLCHPMHNCSVPPFTVYHLHKKPRRIQASTANIVSFNWFLVRDSCFIYFFLKLHFTPRNDWTRMHIYKGLIRLSQCTINHKAKSVHLKKPPSLIQRSCFYVTPCLP